MSGILQFGTMVCVVTRAIELKRGYVIVTEWWSDGHVTERAMGSRERAVWMDRH